MRVAREGFDRERASGTGVGQAGRVLTKNRMEHTAEARVEALQAEIAELESQLTQIGHEARTWMQGAHRRAKEVPA